MELNQATGKISRPDQPFPIIPATRIPLMHKPNFEARVLCWAYIPPCGHRVEYRTPIEEGEWGFCRRCNEKAPDSAYFVLYSCDCIKGLGLADCIDPSHTTVIDPRTTTRPMDVAFDKAIVQDRIASDLLLFWDTPFVVAAVAKAYGVHPATVYRVQAEMGLIESSGRAVPDSKPAVDPCIAPNNVVLGLIHTEPSSSGIDPESESNEYHGWTEEMGDGTDAPRADYRL